MHGGVVQPKKQQQEEQAEEEGAEGAQEEEVAAEVGVLHSVAALHVAAGRVAAMH